MLKRNTDDSPEMEVGKLGPSDYFGQCSQLSALPMAETIRICVVNRLHPAYVEFRKFFSISVLILISLLTGYARPAVMPPFDQY